MWFGSGRVGIEVEQLQAGYKVTWDQHYESGGTVGAGIMAISDESVLAIFGYNINEDNNESGHMSEAGVIALTLSAADGPLPIGEALGTAALIGTALHDAATRVHITYKLTNGRGGIYLGRASGFGTPEQVLNKRYATHHMRAAGYGNPRLDESATTILAYPAIRGREQQLIDFYGGIGSPNVANSIRGVSKYNYAGPSFHKASNTVFGNIAPYTGNIYLFR